MTIITRKCIPKGFALLSLFLSVVCATALAQAPPAAPPHKITLGFGPTALATAFRLLFASVGKTCVVDPDIQDFLSHEQFDRLSAGGTFEEVFSRLLHSASESLTYKVKDGVYLIHAQHTRQNLQPESPLAVTVVVPDADPDRAIDLSETNCHLDVVLENVSRKALRLWGLLSPHSHLTLEVVAIDGKTLPRPVALVPFMTRITNLRDFDAHSDPPLILEPGAKVVRSIRLDDLYPASDDGTILLAFPPIAGKPGPSGLFPVLRENASSEAVTFRIVYRSSTENGGTAGSRVQDVWAGMLVSPTLDAHVQLRPTDSAFGPILSRLPRDKK